MYIATVKRKKEIYEKYFLSLAIIFSVQQFFVT